MIKKINKSVSLKLRKAFGLWKNIHIALTALVKYDYISMDFMYIGAHAIKLSQTGGTKDMRRTYFITILHILPPQKKFAIAKDFECSDQYDIFYQFLPVKLLLCCTFMNLVMLPTGTICASHFKTHCRSLFMRLLFY